MLYDNEEQLKLAEFLAASPLTLRDNNKYKLRMIKKIEIKAKLHWIGLSTDERGTNCGIIKL